MTSVRPCALQSAPAHPRRCCTSAIRRQVRSANYGAPVSFNQIQGRQAAAPPHRSRSPPLPLLGVHEGECSCRWRREGLEGLDSSRRYSVVELTAALFVGQSDPRRSRAAPGSGGALRVYEGAERAGQGACTLVVSAIDEIAAQLHASGLAPDAEPTRNDRVDTVTIKDPDGNSITLPIPKDETVAH
jgi:hypothetical protein